MKLSRIKNSKGAWVREVVKALHQKPEGSGFETR